MKGWSVVRVSAVKQKNICTTSSTYRMIDLWRIPYGKKKPEKYTLSKEISDLIDTKSVLNWQKCN